MPDPYADALAQLRALCLALPETSERMSHGTVAFFVRKRVVANLLDGHHGDEHLAMWCAAPYGVQAQLISAEPERFFCPPYVGHRGWLGVRLDVDPDWEEIGQIVRDAYRCVAPKTLARRLDAPA